MSEEKKIERVNDKMIKISIDIVKMMSNQELYNLFATLKQQEVQYNQTIKKTEHNLNTVRKEIKFIEKIALDCEKRIPKDEKH